MSLKWTTLPFNQKMDAYVDWIENNGDVFPPLDDNYLVSALWFLKEESKVTNSSESHFLNRNSSLGIFGFDFTMFIPPIYLPAGALGDLNLFTSNVPIVEWRKVIKKLKEDPELLDQIDQLIIVRPLPADALCKAIGSAFEDKKATTILTSSAASEQPVVVGVIDEGLAFANERFRKGRTETRVEFAWLQDGRCHSGGVPEFDYGRELTKWDRTANDIDIPGIDTLLARSLQGKVVDEDLFYSLSGVADFSREGHKAAAWRVSHGTHVMDVAAGYDMLEARSTRHIVSVQLPTGIVADTSGLGLEKFLIDGVAYIFDRAKRISDRYYEGAELPIVINFSSGIRAGPHDGSSILERDLDRLILRRRDPAHDGGNSGPPTQVVLPAGNSFQARSHVCFHLNRDRAMCKEDIETVNWHVPPDDRTFSYIELWLPRGLAHAEARKIELTISSPEADKFSAPLVADPNNPKDASIALWDEHNNSLICKAYFQDVPIQTNNNSRKGKDSTRRGRYVIALAPTAFHETDASLAPTGSWKIKLSYSGKKENLEIHGWIHWDDSPINYARFGRQSFFEDRKYQRFGSDGDLNEDDNDDTTIRRTGTINALATGAEPKVIGAYRAADGRASSYTSADFEDRNRKPDYMAVSETSYAHMGILAAGTRSGSTVALNGTSVAAPQVTRAIADLMACGCTDQEIQEKLDEKAQADDKKLERRARSRNPNRQPTVQKERRGKGRLKLDLPRPSNGLRGEFGS